MPEKLRVADTRLIRPARAAVYRARSTSGAFESDLTGITSSRRLSRRAVQAPSEGVARATPGKKISCRGNFFLHGGASGPISQLDPASKKAGRSGVGLTPSVAFFIKARPEVQKAKAQVSTLRRVGA